ncbi:MAG: hypothetical protein K1X88_17280 [Nannocystaceae bacterium]|nr:hypothetical protein [Nannocystaceae bacterium]
MRASTPPAPRFLSIAGIGLLSGIAVASMQGCDPDNPGGSLLEKCGLVCPDEGLADGNASISGVASIDGFFGAVLDVRASASTISGSIRAELEGMASFLAIDGYAEMDLPALSAAVKGAIQAKLSASVEGSLSIKYDPPKCEADLEVTAKAAAECDVEADPGMIEAKCEGSCEVSADVAADCSAMGTLECEGTAPNFECSGSCTGSCQLEVAAACEGSCNGTCQGNCSACAGGACETDGMGFVTNCAGSCDAMCQGECKLEAGGSCGGRCEGSCKYNPGMAMCEAGATAKCDVSAMAEAKCEGKCEGEVTPPMVKAECQAQVEAKAEAKIECRPPSLSIGFQFKAGLDADAQAEFKAFLEMFKTRFSAMLAVKAKADIVAKAAGNLVTAASGAVKGAVDASLEGDLDLKTGVGLGCALEALGEVGGVLKASTDDLTASANAFVEISGAVGAGG